MSTAQNSLNINGSGVVSYNNTTGVFTESALTEHDILIGGASNAIVSISPGTSGFVLTSNGVSADPTFQASSAGSITISGDTGVATGNSLTLYANNAAKNSGSTVSFTNSGTTSFLSLANQTTSSIMLGYGAGNLTATGLGNVGLGNGVLISLTSAAFNVAVGYNALQFLTSSPSGGNIGIGINALASLITGSSNIGIGLSAGNSYTGSESSNIAIQNTGVTGESHVIRLGTQGTSAGQQTSCYIAGINGVTVTGTAVLCSTSGQLGTVVSSRRFKENIVSMDDSSKSIYDLEPVNFTYKSDPKNEMQYGLIAEEVQQVMPYLVVCDEEGNPISVKYHDLPVMLLNEIKKLRRRIEILEGWK